MTVTLDTMKQVMELTLEMGKLKAERDALRLRAERSDYLLDKILDLDPKTIAKLEDVDPEREALVFIVLTTARAVNRAIDANPSAIEGDNNILVPVAVVDAITQLAIAIKNLDEYLEK